MNIDKIKQDFPILARKVNGKPLVYLDNAATTQKPQQVVEAVVDYYYNYNANVHRGVHTLSDESTKLYEESRHKVASFLGAKAKELIFVRNTTEAINLVRFAWVKQNLKEGDIVIASELEHHSNLVVWQEAAKECGAGLTFVDVTPSGEIDLEHLAMLLQALKNDVKLVALSALSNATGAMLPVEVVVKMVRKYAKSAKLLLDGAQWTSRKETNFDRWGADFWAFSGHKMYGPMGIGGLLVKEEILADMEPFLVGGGMISEVGLEGSSYGDLPDKYDAGTPDVAGAVGLAAACKYLDSIGMEAVEKHERELTEYAVERLGDIQEIKIVGPVGKNSKFQTLPAGRQVPNNKQMSKSQTQNSKPITSKSSESRIQNSEIPRLGSVTFLYDGVHAHDVAQVLDSEGIAIRSGHHCTMPLHKKMGWAATTRASFGIYNSKEDVDRLMEALEKVKQVFK